MSSENDRDRNDRCADCDCIDIGDVVEHRMNTNVFGVVLGFEGSLVHLRLSPSLARAAFHHWELRFLDDDDEFDEPEGGESLPEDSNVVPFVLTAATKTKGAA